MSIQKLSSPAKPRDCFHGKLNLEQQKKRAKELFKQVQKSAPDALQRIERSHPRGSALQPGEIKLTHCQLVIARENSFDSWPAMKAHIDSLALAGPVTDDAATLHIRCGTDIKHALELIGFSGVFLEFSDPFCQGPVHDLPIEPFIKMRYEFAAQAYEMTLNDVRARALPSYEGLFKLEQWRRVVFWFEHDSFDQLILAFLLSYVYRNRPDVVLEMICVDQIPGVEDFIGIGQLSPELIRYLWLNERKPITEAQLALGEQVWVALCADSPNALRQITEQGTSAIPMMANALRRHLEELPDPVTGLSLTESLALQLLAGEQNIPAGRLFSRYMRELEPLPWLGDLMFWSIVRQLGEASQPLVSIEKTAERWPTYLVSITDTGRAVLAGQLDYRQLMARDRWVGGVRIKAGG